VPAYYCEPHHITDYTTCPTTDCGNPADGPPDNTPTATPNGSRPHSPTSGWGPRTAGEYPHHHGQPLVNSDRGSGRGVSGGNWPPLSPFVAAMPVPVAVCRLPTCW
jgi:hypothetical protein